MVVTISLYDVLLSILCVAGITLLVSLVITVNNINSVLKDVKYLFNKNKNNIDLTIASLPEIAVNIKGITGEVKDGVTTITSTAVNIEKNIDKSSGIISEKINSALDYSQILSEVIRAGISYLGKRK